MFLQGDNVIIAGKVNGNLRATTSITLIAPAVVQGDIATPVLSVSEGAVIEGRCSMLNLSSHDADEILNLRDVAQYLEVEARVVEEWANQKKIPAQLENGEWKFNRMAVDQWVQDEKIKQ